MVKFKIKRNIFLDLFAIIVSLVSISILVLIVFSAIKNRHAVNHYAFLTLGSVLSLTLTLLFNTKCYVEDNVLYVKFMWTKKEIPIENIISISSESFIGVASKFTIEGIGIEFKDKFSNNDVVISVVDEKGFVDYLNSINDNIENKLAN